MNSDLKFVIENMDQTLRINFAKSLDCTKNIFKILYQDEDPGVRKALLTNERCPAYIVIALRTDKDPEVSDVAKNRMSDVEIKAYDQGFRESNFAKNPFLSSTKEYEYWEEGNQDRYNLRGT